LAGALSDSLQAGEAPDLPALRARFSPDPQRLPQVCVQLTPLSVYEDLLGQAAGEAAGEAA
ncbi:transposase, partial [mine drainage metagenome]